MDRRRGQIPLMALCLVMAWCFSFFILSPDSFAAATKIKGTGKHVSISSEMKLYPGDVPGHEIVLTNFQSVDKSDHPDFKEVHVDIFGSSDLVAGNGSHKGYRVATHPNGDHTFMTYEGATKTVMKDENVPLTTIEGKWRFTGGTGKFEGITGGGSYTGKLTQAGFVYEWEGEFDIK